MSRRLRTYLESCQQIESLEISLLVPSDKQVRSELGNLHELCASIREHGLLMPLLVRPKGSRFEVICGNRRLEACRRLLKRYVNCIIRDLSDQTAFEVSIIENIQRETLSTLEEARAFQRYVSEFGWGGISNLATRIGKSEEYVSHRILLLNLPKKILTRLEKNKISPSQAQELLWFKNLPLRDQILDQLDTERLSVAEIRQIRKELESEVINNGSLAESFNPGRIDIGQKQPASVMHLADSNPDFMPESFGPAAMRSGGSDHNKSKDHNVIEEAILALRVALIRLDSAISKCESKNSRSLLMSERLTLHGQIDRLIRANAEFPSL